MGRETLTITQSWFQLKKGLYGSAIFRFTKTFIIISDIFRVEDVSLKKKNFRA